MFLKDKEKMIDFELLSKEQFLREYDYIKEKEYDETLIEYAKEKISEQVTAEIYSIDYIIQNNFDEKEVVALIEDKETDEKKMINIQDEMQNYNFTYEDFKVEDLLGDLNGDYKLLFASNEFVEKNMGNLLMSQEKPFSYKAGIKEFIRGCKACHVDESFVKRLEDKVQKNQTIIIQDNNEIMDVKSSNSDTLVPKNKIELLKEFKSEIVKKIAEISDGKFISKPKQGCEPLYTAHIERIRMLDKIIQDEIKLEDKTLKGSAR